MRGRSYTPSPPGGYGRRGRSPSPRGRYGGGRGRDHTTSLLVRNLRHDCRPDDLRRPFGQFGPLKDIYLPKDYYTGQPRGFGFVQYVEPADAAEAKYQMDGHTLFGRELTVVFAEENRKKPTEMRARERRGPSYDRRRYPRYSRSPLHSRYSRSPPRHRSHSRSHDDYPSAAKRRKDSRSLSPEERRYGRERSYSPEARERSYSPQARDRPYSPEARERPYSPPARDRPYSPPARDRPYFPPARDRSYTRSPPLNGSRSRSQSPK